MDIDKLPKLVLCPLLADYDVEYDDDVLTTQYIGGQPRQRLKGVGAPHVVSVAFKHKKDHQQYLYNFLMLNRAMPFAMRLIIGDTDMRWYECRRISTFKPTVLGGGVFGMQFNMSVTPEPFDDVVAQDFVDAYILTGGELTGFFNVLEKLVNEDLPRES